MELSNRLSGKESGCQAGDLGSVSGLERSTEERNGNHCSIIAWKIPWTEELGRLQSMTVTKELDMIYQLNNNSIDEIG